MAGHSRLEVYFGVLDAIRYGTEKPTRLMYQTILSVDPSSRSNVSVDQ